MPGEIGGVGNNPNFNINDISNNGSVENVQNESQTSGSSKVEKQTDIKNEVHSIAPRTTGRSKSSIALFALRIIGGIFTIGISEGIRGIVKGIQNQIGKNILEGANDSKYDFPASHPKHAETLMNRMSDFCREHPELPQVKTYDEFFLVYDYALDAIENDIKDGQLSYSDLRTPEDFAKTVLEYVNKNPEKSLSGAALGDMLKINTRSDFPRFLPNHVTEANRQIGDLREKYCNGQIQMTQKEFDEIVKFSFGMGNPVNDQISSKMIEGYLHLPEDELYTPERFGEFVKNNFEKLIQSKLESNLKVEVGNQNHFYADVNNVTDVVDRSVKSFCETLPLGIQSAKVTGMSGKEYDISCFDTVSYEDPSTKEQKTKTVFSWNKLFNEGNYSREQMKDIVGGIVQNSSYYGERRNEVVDKFFDQVIDKNNKESLQSFVDNLGHLPKTDLSKSGDTVVLEGNAPQDKNQVSEQAPGFVPVMADLLAKDNKSKLLGKLVDRAKTQFECLDRIKEKFGDRLHDNSVKLIMDKIKSFSLGYKKNSLEMVFESLFNEENSKMMDELELVLADKSLTTEDMADKINKTIRPLLSNVVMSDKNMESKTPGIPDITNAIDVIIATLVGKNPDIRENIVTRFDDLKTIILSEVIPDSGNERNIIPFKEHLCLLLKDGVKTNDQNQVTGMEWNMFRMREGIVS